MPRYKLITQKFFGSEYWVNDYYFTATDLDDADSKAQPIVDAEIATHLVGITFDMYRISTVEPDDGIFRNFSVLAACTAVGGGDILALFNCARVDFPAAVGRAGRKYLRGVLSEGGVAFDTLGSGTRIAINDSYANPLRLLGYLEKPNGTLLVDAVVHPKLAMRQLRRGSRRRTTPIIP
jgi:hypothetical protein